MPYKDPEAQRNAMKRWRQGNLFAVQDYEANRRVRPPEYHVTRQANAQARYARDRGPKTFVGCDGEGMGEGYDHAYYVWRMGSQVLVTGKPLETREILEFILAQPQGPIYVGFSLNYDFTMILRGLPNNVVSDLLNRAAREIKDGRGVRAVRWEGIRLDYIPHKRLSVGRGDKTIVIHDVFGFFQSTFVTALDEWDMGTPEERQQIAEGKERRGQTDVLSEEELAYNERECQLLSEMMFKLDTVTQSIMLSAAPYEGAGAIASSLFKIHVTKPIMERNKRGANEPPTFSEMDPAKDGLPSWDAYYGGRFEITAHGPISRPVYEYDINSAYPAVIRDLPCLLHGKWTQGYSGRHSRGTLWDARTRPCIGFVRWQVGANNPFGPLPHRNNKGNVAFPLMGAGWYWSVEWPTDPATFEILESWEFHAQCDHRPFTWVEDRYRQRKEHKAAGRKGQAMMLKLGYNSLYGKMAQSIGKAPWRNSVYAGLVTATCRRWLRDAAEQNPQAIVMFATDGLYSLEPLQLPVGSGLGQWEFGVYDTGLHIVRPGIYFADGGEAKVKSRGIARKVVANHASDITRAFDDIYSHREWLTDPRAPKLMEDWGVPLQFNGLVSIRLAYSQNHPERAGYFGTLPHRMSYSIFPKRIPLDTDNFERNWRDGILRSGPPKVGPAFRSLGYGRSTLDIDESTMDMVESAPDWGSPVQLEMDW